MYHFTGVSISSKNKEILIKQSFHIVFIFLITYMCVVTYLSEKWTGWVLDNNLWIIFFYWCDYGIFTADMHIETGILQLSAVMI